MERELAPERGVRTGMCMVRDSRREARLWPLHWVEDDELLVFSRLRGLAISGGGVPVLAGLEVPVTGMLERDF